MNSRRHPWRLLITEKDPFADHIIQKRQIHRGISGDDVLHQHHLAKTNRAFQDLFKDRVQLRWLAGSVNHLDTFPLTGRKRSFIFRIDMCHHLTIIIGAWYWTTTRFRSLPCNILPKTQRILIEKKKINEMEFFHAYPSGQNVFQVTSVPPNFGPKQFLSALHSRTPTKPFIIGGQGISSASAVPFSRISYATDVEAWRVSQHRID